MKRGAKRVRKGGATPRTPRVRVPSLVLQQALATLGGAQIVLDRELRVVAATPRAVALLGTAIPPGTAMAKLLCGDAPTKPVAEALAEGRAVAARVMRPGAGGKDRALDVRATPLAGELADVAEGFVLELSEVAPIGEERDGATWFHGIWTRDPSMRAVLAIVEKAARSDATVLLRGETGTGKELFARALHALSNRSSGPFHAINCAALPATLLESELFGHVRGSFTGAVRDAPGHFRLADHGTLFLDEIADMPAELQAKLLRVLQTRTVIPVGGAESIPVDVRIVSATHRSLRAEVEAGRFRADLMYRLRVVPIFLPALRERGDDVLLLAEKIVERLNRSSERQVEELSRAASEALASHGWPGNVRELENALEYAYVVGEGPILEAHELPPEIVSPGLQLTAPPVNAPPPISDVKLGPEAARIVRALERAGGSKARAAQLLGVSRVTLWRRMRELGLAPEASKELR